jgi:hypothetical protein
MRTSTIYTIGTALNRAQGSDVTVDVLVDGHWLHGHVTAVDGHGLVLHGDDDMLSVLRMDSITAVQVRQSSAFEQLPEGTTSSTEDAHPMPAAPSPSHAPDWARPEAARVAAQPWTGPVRERRSTEAYAFGPGPSAGVVPSPRGMPRPTVGPIVAPSAVPDAGLHTMLRSRRTVVEPRVIESTVFEPEPAPVA